MRAARPTTCGDMRLVHRAKWDPFCPVGCSSRRRKAGGVLALPKTRIAVIVVLLLRGALETFFERRSNLVTPTREQSVSLCFYFAKSIGYYTKHKSIEVCVLISKNKNIQRGVRMGEQFCALNELFEKSLSNKETGDMYHDLWHYTSAMGLNGILGKGTADLSA